jgi:hypothetical protein
MGRKPIETVNAVKPPAGEAYVAIDSPRGELRQLGGQRRLAAALPLQAAPPSYHALSRCPTSCPG